jgi:hypothetical protein
MNRTHSIQLLGFRDNIHVAHWQAPRKTNEHAALGELYEAILPMIDEATEIAIAGDGDLEFPQIAIVIVNRAGYADLLSSGLTCLDLIRATLTVGKDDALLNILADISGAILRCAYKLEVKP